MRAARRTVLGRKKDRPKRPIRAGASRQFRIPHSAFRIRANGPSAPGAGRSGAGAGPGRAAVTFARAVHYAK